jgi:hypothetical protein
MTSVFLHAFPPLVAWAGRWYPGDPNHWKGPQDYACQGEHATATVRELILVPWAPYALWAVAYYLKIFVVSSQRIQDRGYHTLFKYTTRKPNSLAGKMAKKLPRWVAPIVFMANHVVFCAVTFAFTWFMWSHYWVNTLFVIWCIAMSAWNGGNYYFEVFAHKYVAEVGISKHDNNVASDPVQLRAHSIDGKRNAEGLQSDDGVDIRGVGRSHSDGALTSPGMVEEMAYLNQAISDWKQRQMLASDTSCGDTAAADSLSSRPTDSADVEPAECPLAGIEKGNTLPSYPVISNSELPISPTADRGLVLDEGIIRRRGGTAPPAGEAVA